MVSKQQDANIEVKTVNETNFARLKNKKKVTSQRTFSFINKGALQLDCQKFSDMICGMEIDGEINKNWSGKSVTFFVRNCFSMEAVSPYKNSDLTVNNTHNQSSVSPNKSIATPDNLQNLQNFIESNQQSQRSVT